MIYSGNRQSLINISPLGFRGRLCEDDDSLDFADLLGTGSDMPPVLFRPHPLLRGGHAQTLGALFVPGKKLPYTARPIAVRTDDGDQVVIHDDCPVAWQPGGRAALLIHGMSGCHQSSYMQRLTAKLLPEVVRVFRMDQRACGAGLKLARRPYHAGLWSDIARALDAIGRECPGSPVALIGFSLGGTLALNLLVEGGESIPSNLDRAAVVSPPIDLLYCARALQLPRNRVYDRHFIRALWQHFRDWRKAVPDSLAPMIATQPRNLWHLDELLTAPTGGFPSAEKYYRRCSPVFGLDRVRVPTLYLTSRDDPLVPSLPVERAKLSSSIKLVLTEYGGHLGYFGRRGTDPDRRWMDWRLVEWIIGPLR